MPDKQHNFKMETMNFNIKCFSVMLEYITIHSLASVSPWHQTAGAETKEMGHVLFPTVPSASFGVILGLVHTCMLVSQQ